MTTFAPIQPRPIICKTTTNNAQSSSPIFLLQPSTVTNTNFYQTNADLNNNHSSQVPSLPSAPLSSYEEFLKRLREFHRCRQTTFRCLPTIAGQVVDLQLLYTTVVNYGGWDKVNDRHFWSSIANNFGIDSSCLNGTQALKQIYIRYLYAFEKISNGENIDSRGDDDEDSKRRTGSQLQRVPQSYNHAQHIVPDALRLQHGLFTDFVRRNEYEKLELALLCGFPNELTFTLNTLLLLSSSTNNSKSFHLYKCPRLLEILFRHIGLFLSSDTYLNDHYLKILYDNIWSKHLNYHMKVFWIQSCSPKILKLLLNIDLDKEEFYQNFNFDSNEYQQEQEFRIEQILMIIRNLSFDRLNALYLLDTIQSTSSITYIFLLLISYCQKKIQLEKYAYDIWTNLALYMHLRMINNDEGILFRQLLNNMLIGNEEDNQQDRFKIIRALEIIANLAQAGNDNAIYLIDFIHIMVNQLIHIPDILILVHTLETLYQLSELGEQCCDAILKVQSSTPILSTLIDLLTIEARSFSSQTIKTIKIVEMSSGPVLLPSYHQPLPQQSIAPQSVAVIPTNPPAQQQTYAIENTEINKIYYSNNNKLVLPQHSKPLTVTGVISSGNLLSVSTASTPNSSIIVANTNAQSNQTIDKQRKHDSISETIAAVVNGTPPPPKRSRPSHPRSIPSKTPIHIGPSRLIPSSSIEDESSMESNTTSNSIHSTMADLLDRCSSPPLIINTFENDIRSCLNDLCQRVEQSLSGLYNQIPSPIFKRKIEEQSISNKRTTKDPNNIEEPPLKKKRNRSSTKKFSTDISNVTVSTGKKEEPIEQELSDVKPNISTSSLITTSVPINPSDYVCEWDNCRATFTTARSVFHHACSAHVKHSPDYICLWSGCDRLKRQKWALISHIQERHCSETAFRQAKFKTTNNIPNTSANTSGILSNPAPIINNGPSSTGISGYAPDAAWHAIRRHLQTNSFDDLPMKNKEGPLTKSIRLTAALILRNIAQHSSIGKQNLRQYEQLITNLALESSEASNTLTSCLFELYN